MKNLLLPVFSLSINLTQAEKPDNLVVFYFGAPDCSYDDKDSEMGRCLISFGLG